MKKGNEYIGIVERVEFGGRGIVRCVEEVGGNGGREVGGNDGREVGENGGREVDENGGNFAVVKNCIAGQKIVFRVRKKRNGKAEGDLVRVVESSKLETETPNCPHFGICGSCRYQTLPYEAELLMKERQIRDILDKAVAPYGYPYAWTGIVPNPTPYEYRNKMEFSFGNAVKGGPLTLGLHKKGSFYDICEVSECRIVDADFRVILTETLALCQSYALSFYHKMTHRGYLRHLLVRKAAHTGEILVDLVTSSQAPQNEADFLAAFAARLRAVLPNGIVSILHTVNDSLSDTIQNDKTDICYGRDYIEETILGLRFQISAFSFFQTNSKGAERLYETARAFVLGSEGAREKEEKREENALLEEINFEAERNEKKHAAERSLGNEKTGGKIIFDLYSGTGTIAQLLAPVAKKVIGVEIIEEAVASARINAKKNGLDNCAFLAGDVLKVLDTIEEKPDFIVLDPPRDGIHPKALKTIIAYGVDRILYISCKPTSLARDLVALQEAGYRIERAAAVDLFSKTYHVETVVLLSKLHETKHLVNVKVNDL